jgi:Polyketide cyclase / dehydrase and lipid transport
MPPSTPRSPWPEHLDPDSSSVFVHNELQTSASCAAVWDTLIRATEWPSWYRHARDVRLDDGAERLSADSSFRWQASGQRVRSSVRVFEPGRELAWDARNALIRVHHRWSFEERDAGCFIVTEEAQRGPLPWATRPIARRIMLGAHQEWLECLGRRAREEAGRAEEGTRQGG